MPPSRLSVATSAADGRTVLRLDGELDIATLPELTTCAHLALREGPEELVLDLGDLTFFGSAGVTALIEIDDAARLAGCRVTVVRVPAMALRVLTIVGVTQRLTIRP